MAKKLIVIGDSSTFRNGDVETMRLEATFGAFRNNYLSEYLDQIDWVVVGQRDILTSAPHKFFKFDVVDSDIEEAKKYDISFGIYSLTQLKSRITERCHQAPDLIIFSSGSIKDWEEFDKLTNSLGAEEQEAIRKSIIMINTTCCRYDIVVPEIIRNLGLAKRPE